MFLRKHYKFIKPFLMFEEGDTLTKSEGENRWYVDETAEKFFYGDEEIKEMLKQGFIEKYTPAKCECKK